MKSLLLLFLLLGAAALKQCDITCPKAQQACSIKCLHANETADCSCDDLALTARCVCADLLGCSMPNGPCDSMNPCCYSCTGSYCTGGMCSEGTCYGTGASCDSDCLCCSQDCDISDLDPGTCT